MKKYPGSIVLFVLALFIAFVIIWYISYRRGGVVSYPEMKLSSQQELYHLVPLERETFKRSAYALEYKDMVIEKKYQRSLSKYYANRAYEGAPPTIPHEIERTETIGGKDCLKCHQNGGFVPKWQAYAPVTPHPELLNCRQCHAEGSTMASSVSSNFQKEIRSRIGANSVLPGSPPVIPHKMWMRENCLACHAGPAAPKEIRVTHPERINCRQCHAQSDPMNLDKPLSKTDL